VISLLVKGLQGASGREMLVFPPDCAEERSLPHYRCNMLDEDGDTLPPADIVAGTLNAAIKLTARILNTSGESQSPSRLVYAFEVWSDGGRMFLATTAEPWAGATEK
jgi:hypothetical protein